MRWSDVFAMAAAIAALYWVLRFAVFELATVILRRVPAARRWARRRNAEGRLLASVRSPELYAGAMRGLAGAIERVSGKGVLGGLTFFLVGSAVIFLATAPILELRPSLDRYKALQGALADPAKALQAEQGLCATEHLWGAYQRRTGRAALDIPRGFAYYPYGDAVRDRIDRAARDALSAFEDELYGRGPDGERQRAYAAAAVAYCRDGAVQPGFTPVRDRQGYHRMVEIGRSGLAAILADRQIADSYGLAQRQLVLNRALLGFFSALGSGLALWLAARMAIVLCGMTRPRLWLAANVLIVALAFPATFLVATVSNVLTAGAQATAPTALILAVMRVGPGRDEADYRRRADYAFGRAADLETRVCAEVGPDKPLTPLCNLQDAYLAPWNPATRHFDFAAALPGRIGDDAALSAAMLPMMRASLLTTGLIAGARDNQAGPVPTGPAASPFGVWRGPRSALTMLLINLPLFLVLVVGAALAVALEFRWTLVRRVARIAAPTRRELG